MNKLIDQAAQVVRILKPENSFERNLLAQVSVQRGMFWGKPRFGHPEGKVLFHIKEVLDNIDKLRISSLDRSVLRTIALVHDTFKYQEDHFPFPRTWEQNHAHLAKSFLAEHTKDELLLRLVEFHDEAYYIWRNIFLRNKKEAGLRRLNLFLQKFEGHDRQLYYLFFKCDTRTGDKNQSPLKWFEREIKGIEIAVL